MSEMKLSEAPMSLSSAIRLGAMLGRQTRGQTYGPGGASCVQGSAARALGGWKKYKFASDLRNVWPELHAFATDLVCPRIGCGWKFHGLFGEFQMLAHLNDYHKMTRETIADIVEIWEHTIEQAQSSALVPQSAENIIWKKLGMGIS